jgi:hypothetical protein
MSYSYEEIMEREDVFGARRRALEESFFAKRDAELLANLQRQSANQEAKQALRAASGIADEAVLEHLVAANITAETVTALEVIPLLAVAWADGNLDEREKKAVLSASEAEGIRPGSSAYALLDSWLREPPSDSLLVAWKDFIQAAQKSLSPQALSALREDVLNRARKVARASGGLLGVRSVSEAEDRVFHELEQAFRST